ncbi:MAG: nucleotidyltransferase family protein [Clostridia bacterium]|nr:nucleotidyltransferase family protein [Clostridia bacterium]
MRIGCIILAAGLSTRFGRNKLAEPVNGETMIRHAVRVYASQGFDVSVLVANGDNREVLDAAAGRFDAVAINPHPERGISSSIRIGIRRLLLTAVSKGRILDGVLFGVCDQPGLSAGTVGKLQDAFSGHPDRIVAPVRSDGKRGNPVIFPVGLLSELMELEGDRGGSAVISRHPDLLLTVETAAEELDDIDTPEDIRTGGGAG